MLNEVKHLAISREILRGVYPRAKRRTQNDIVHYLNCDRVLLLCPVINDKDFVQLRP
jgi:hypothetical protein